jgi:glycine dehydrogenase subunit 2
LVLLRAYVYILSMGRDGLKKASEMAVLNANYMRKKLSEFMTIAYPGLCKHEFVVEGTFLKEYDVKTLDFAKRMLDYGIHPSTIYFPLIVKEAMMIEPTETESKGTIDEVIEIFKNITEEAKQNPRLLKDAPFSTPVKRLDELKANKELKVRF